MQGLPCFGIFAAQNRRRVNLEIFPAIDLRDGQAVRLTQGDFKQSTIYSKDPVELAARMREQGAKNLHVVDLDGALAGAQKR